MTVMGQRLVPALLIAGIAATAGAQSKACDIDESRPAQVTRAVLDIQIAQQSAKPEDAATKLKDAIKLLHEGDMKVNPVGRVVRAGPDAGALHFAADGPERHDHARRAWLRRQSDGVVRSVCRYRLGLQRRRIGEPRV